MEICVTAAQWLLCLPVTTRRMRSVSILAIAARPAAISASSAATSCMGLHLSEMRTLKEGLHLCQGTSKHFRLPRALQVSTDCSAQLSPSSRKASHALLNQPPQILGAT